MTKTLRELKERLKNRIVASVYNRFTTGTASALKINDDLLKIVDEEFLEMN